MIFKELVGKTILISTIINTVCFGQPPLETIKQWNVASFDFPYDWPINNKELYNPEQIVTTGFEIGNNRIFIATPRLFSGVPATISAISREPVGDSPVLQVMTKLILLYGQIKIMKIEITDHMIFILLVLIFCEVYEKLNI